MAEAGWVMRGTVRKQEMAGTRGFFIGSLRVIACLSYAPAEDRLVEQTCHSLPSVINIAADGGSCRLGSQGRPRWATPSPTLAAPPWTATAEALGVLEAAADAFSFCAWG